MTQASRTLVYASYVSPFPTNSGERIRAINILSALNSLGYEIEAIVGNYDGITLGAYGREGIRFQQIPFEWPRLRQAAEIYFKPHRRFVEQVTAIHRERPLAAVFLDYGFMGAQIDPFVRLGIPVVLGTHNLESALTAQAPRETFKERFSLRLRHLVERVHERRFFRGADAIICVSEDDRRAYEAFIPADRLFVVPNFVDIQDHYGATQRMDRIIMTGSFGNFQNVEGLHWFIDKVWDDELQARVILCVAGNNSERAVAALGDRNHVVALGSRDDLLSEVARSRCAIAPLWHGGGTRFKCIEAMAVRTPVVTTSKGCEGIEHDNSLCVADTAPAFKAAILNLLDNQAETARRTTVARAAYDRSYSLAANAAQFDQVMTSAMRNSLNRVFR